MQSLANKLYVLTIVYQSYKAHVVISCIQLCVSQSGEPLSYRIVILSPVTSGHVYLWIMPCCGVICAFPAFPVFCCPCPNLFEMCCWHGIQSEHIFAKINKVNERKTLNTFSLCCFEIEYVSKRISSISHAVLFVFFTEQPSSFGFRVKRLIHVLGFFCY